MFKTTIAAAIFLAMCLVVFSPVRAQSDQESASTAATPAGQEILTALPVQSADYPRLVEFTEGAVTIHHPVIEDWLDFESLTAWIAIEVLEDGAEQPWVGSVLVTAKTDIDFDERLVVLHDLKILERKFPDGEPGQLVKELVGKAVTRGPRSMLLDVFLRALPEDFEIPNQGSQIPQLNFEPPRIVVSTTPMQLMFIDGEPVAAPIEGSSLEFLVNTNWDVFHDTRSDRWYVLNSGSWQISKSLVDGPWQSTDSLPDGFDKLPENENWTEVHAALPATMPADEPAPILVSMEPTELILLEGEIELAEIPGTSVRYLANTQSDLFEIEGQFYYLASGRWFSAGDLSGDWSAVSDLPADFAGIPQEHEKGHVLASVPGTEDARAALIEASIPRKASISKDAGKDMQVTYAGEPEFVNIAGTELQRAANTPYQIIAYNDYYYLCYNAVWYFARHADGPWSVASNIPQEIYKIPASDPAHNVTYVFVEADDDDDEYVDYHYTSGYTSTYAVNLVIVYGTGWYYNPWTYWHPWGYPVYGHYPHSYGYGAWYNPATGRYGERAVGYGPYGGVAGTAVYNPATGGYARGQAVWDNDELARRGYGYNPRSDTFAAGNMYYDFDDNEGWRQGYVERGDRWVYSETSLDGNRATTDYVTSGGLEGTSTRIREDDVITGSGSIEGERGSAQTSSRIDEQGAQLNLDGSLGGELEVSKDWGEAGREFSGTTSEGTGFGGETSRTDSGGLRTDLSTDQGGEAVVRREDGNRSFAGESSSGDLYAGHNGNVYKKTDDGWSQYGDGGWSTMDQLEREHGGNVNRDKLQSSAGQYDRNQLNRQYNARQSGQRNYSSYQQQRGSYGGNRSTAGRRRR